MRALLILAACSSPVASPSGPIAPDEKRVQPIALGYTAVGAPDEAAFAKAMAAHDVAAIEALLAIDLPAFEERARAVVSTDMLHAAWTAAITRGAPMLMFDGTRGEQEILSARVLRVGAWVDDRFVPVGPPVKDAVAGWLDLAHGRAITVGLQVDDCKSDFCPKLTRVHVEAWSTTGKRLASFTRTTEEAHAVIVESGAALRVQLVDCSVQGCRTPWEVLDGKPDADEPIRLTVDHRGSQLQLPHPGFTVRDARLVSNAKTYAIDKRHGQLDCVAADATHAIVASTVDRCDCENDSKHILVHQVDRVDLASGATTELDRGSGQSAIAVGKGGVVLQLGERVEKFASLATVGTASGTALPKGFVLLPPAGARYCCGL